MLRTKKVKILFDLFKNFSSHFRNKLVHGVYTEINDNDVLRYCYLINKNLILRIEKYLEIEYGNKALGDLRNWKFERRIPNDYKDVEEIIKKYRLGAKTKDPLSKDEVRIKLEEYKIIV